MKVLAAIGLGVILGCLVEVMQRLRNGRVLFVYVLL